MTACYTVYTSRQAICQLITGDMRCTESRVCSRIFTSKQSTQYYTKCFNRTADVSTRRHTNTKAKNQLIIWPNRLTGGTANEGICKGKASYFETDARGSKGVLRSRGQQLKALKYSKNIEKHYNSSVGKFTKKNSSLGVHTLNPKAEINSI